MLLYIKILLVVLQCCEADMWGFVTRVLSVTRVIGSVSLLAAHVFRHASIGCLMCSVVC